MKISFILPIYKVEAYLRECVDSLTSQTYKDIEIILVDDGSPDGCPALCDQLATEDSRIVALHKPNGGLSDARNYGLQHATGDYVIFVDSDDFWCHNDSLQKIVEELKNDQIDVLCFNISYYYEDTNSYKHWAPFPNSVLSPTTPSIFLIEMQKIGTLPMSACSKVIRRKFLIDNKIAFIKGIRGEDSPWMIDLLDKAKKIHCVNQYVYAYRQNREGSITNTFKIENRDSLCVVLDRELSLIDKRSFSLQGKLALKSFLASLLCQRIPSISMVRNNDDRKILVSRVKPYLHLLEYDLNPKVRLTKVVYKLTNLRITAFILNLYMKKRSKRR